MTTTLLLHDETTCMRRVARADALLCVLGDTFPAPPSPRTLNGWPIALRAALADRAAFINWLEPVVRLEACDSPARDLLTSYLLACTGSQPAQPPMWAEMAWVAPFMRLLDDRCERGGSEMPHLGRDEVVKILDEALIAARMHVALLPEAGGVPADDSIRRAIVTLAHMYGDGDPAQIEVVLLGVVGHTIRILQRARGERPLDAAPPATPDVAGELLDRVGSILDCVPSMGTDLATLAMIVEELLHVRPLARAVLTWDGDRSSAAAFMETWRAALLRNLDAGQLPDEVYASTTSAPAQEGVC